MKFEMEVYLREMTARAIKIFTLSWSYAMMEKYSQSNWVGVSHSRPWNLVMPKRFQEMLQWWWHEHEAVKKIGLTRLKRQIRISTLAQLICNFLTTSQQSCLKVAKFLTNIETMKFAWEITPHLTNPAPANSNIGQRVYSPVHLPFMNLRQGTRLRCALFIQAGRRIIVVLPLSAPHGWHQRRPHSRPKRVLAMLHIQKRE